MTAVDEKITDFVHRMTDDLRMYDLEFYRLLLESIPSGFYGFALLPISAIIDAVKVR